MLLTVFPYDFFQTRFSLRFLGVPKMIRCSMPMLSAGCRCFVLPPSPRITPPGTQHYLSNPVVPSPPCITQHLHTNLCAPALPKAGAQGSLKSPPLLVAVFDSFCIRFAYVFDSLLAGALFLDFGPRTIAVAAAVAVAVTGWLRQ